uniref:Uncharacterized protein n=1 Tax=Pipistrellus kuhlii TaxID=59472 RepID=A0A7J7UA28_PIPKU|nr:hypothetical protein mPipKuh1_009144 [Pipistrellus kuhlii]
MILMPRSNLRQIKFKSLRMRLGPRDLIVEPRQICCCRPEETRLRSQHNPCPSSLPTKCGIQGDEHIMTAPGVARSADSERSTCPSLRRQWSQVSHLIGHLRIMGLSLLIYEIGPNDIRRWVI